MGKTRQDQTSSEQETDALKAEDETLNTNKAAIAIPLGIGQMKTAMRWITPIYGQRATKIKNAAGTGKGGK